MNVLYICNLLVYYSVILMVVVLVPVAYHRPFTILVHIVTILPNGIVIIVLVRPPLQLYNYRQPVVVVLPPDLQEAEVELLAVVHVRTALGNRAVHVLVVNMGMAIFHLMLLDHHRTIPM